MLLLHGLGDNGLCWTPVARDLAATHAVVMTDARGHGLTGGDLERFSTSTLADDAAAVIEALGLNRPVVWGHSMGALTAAELAMAYPELVRAVLLEDPPLFESDRQRLSDDQQVAQAVQEIVALRTLSPAERLLKAQELQPNWAEAELEPWVESKTQYNLAVWQKISSFTAVSWRKVIAHITCPILLLTGNPANGAIVTLQQAAEAQSLWKSGEVAYMSGAGHNVHRDCYADVLATIRSFLARYPAE